jgi:hypothetical protein
VIILENLLAVQKEGATAILLCAAIRLENSTDESQFFLIPLEVIRWPQVRNTSGPVSVNYFGPFVVLIPTKSQRQRFQKYRSIRRPIKLSNGRVFEPQVLIG